MALVASFTVKDAPSDLHSSRRLEWRRQDSPFVSHVAPTPPLRRVLQKGLIFVHQQICKGGAALISKRDIMPLLLWRSKGEQGRLPKIRPPFPEEQRCAIHLLRSHRGGRGREKWPIMRTLVLIGCVKLQTRGEGVQNPNFCERNKWIPQMCARCPSGIAAAVLR